MNKDGPPAEILRVQGIGLMRDASGKGRFVSPSGKDRYRLPVDSPTYQNTTWRLSDTLCEPRGMEGGEGERVELNLPRVEYGNRRK